MNDTLEMGVSQTNKALPSFARSSLFLLLSPTVGFSRQSQRAGEMPMGLHGEAGAFGNSCKKSRSFRMPLGASVAH